MARSKADLKLDKKPTNRILYGTNLRGVEIKSELRKRACDETLKIYDLLELGKSLSEISPTGFNPRKPRFTDWQKLLELIAKDYAAELAKEKEAENKTEKIESKKEEKKQPEKEVKKMT